MVKLNAQSLNIFQRALPRFRMIRLFLRPFEDFLQQLGYINLTDS